MCAIALYSAVARISVSSTGYLVGVSITEEVVAEVEGRED